MPTSRTSAPLRAAIASLSGSIEDTNTGISVNSFVIYIISKYPEIIDYYIKYKEENEEEATSLSKEAVREVKQLFNIQLRDFVELLYNRTDFYKEKADSYEEAYKRVMFLKSAIMTIFMLMV